MAWLVYLLLKLLLEGVELYVLEQGLLQNRCLALHVLFLSVVLDLCLGE